MIAAGAPVVEVDPAAIGRFYIVAFDGLRGFADVRLLAEKGTPDRRPQCSSMPIDEKLPAALVALATRAAVTGRACTVVPVSMVAAGRTRLTSVLQSALITVDLDDGDVGAKLAHLVEHLGPPTLTVASGGVTPEGQAKLHAHWRLKDPVSGTDLDRLRGVREVLARKVGGDASVARLQQPIRLPGSVHGKHGLPTPVRITEDTGATYALADLERAAGTMPAASAGLDAGDGPRRKTITKFDAISRLIGGQVRRVRLGEIGCTEAWQAVLAFNAQIEQPWGEARLRREFDALTLVDRRNHPDVPGSDHDLDRTEHGLARQLIDDHGSAWRWRPDIGWLSWTGSRWRYDETNRMQELCRGICEGAARGESAAERRRLLRERTICAIERLARSDPRTAASPGEWDVDPMLLNTPAGVIDLRTGQVSPSDPRHHMTRITSAMPGRECPRWQDFIREITGGDEELAKYLQRIAGYSLTARTDEQAFFFLLGSGSNGKSVFVEVLAHVLGSYACAAPLDAFMNARSDRPSNDLASFDGARLVIATEIEAGRSWSESRLKAVTGGDRMAVRKLYREFYEARPAYKLLIAGNHRPRLTGGGKSMARRLQLIPFDAVIPEDQRDGQLREKLLQEADGILSWMLEGCRQWQSIGLRPPQKVRDAGATYFNSEDFVGQWIQETCEVDPGAKATSAALFKSWCGWAETLGLDPGDARTLGERLRDLGFQNIRSQKARGWQGIRIRPLKVAEEWV